jgi:hypothetical protein
MSTQTRATYRTMAEGTADDYGLIIRAEEANNAGLMTRVLKLVEALADGQQAYPVSRLEHSLQSATRAFNDRRSVEYVVAALLHDIGDTYAPHAHGAFAAAVVSSSRRLRGGPDACWGSQCKSGRSQRRSSRFTLQFLRRSIRVTSSRARNSSSPTLVSQLPLRRPAQLRWPAGGPGVP